MLEAIEFMEDRQEQEMNIAGENEEIDEILYTLCRHNVSIMGGT